MPPVGRSGYGVCRRKLCSCGYYVPSLFLLKQELMLARAYVEMLSAYRLSVCCPKFSSGACSIY